MTASVTPLEPMLRASLRGRIRHHTLAAERELAIADALTRHAEEHYREGALQQSKANDLESELAALDS